MGTATAATASTATTDMATELRAVDDRRRTRLSHGPAARERFMPRRRPALRLVPPLPEESKASVVPAAYTDPWLEPRDGSGDAARRTVVQLPGAAGGDLVGAAAHRTHLDAAAVSSPREIPSGRRQPVRLTRRGRIVVVVALTGLVALIIALASATGQAAAPGRAPHAIVVHEGDTLWSIAARVHPHGSLTATMLEIERLNHMSSGTVYVGQQLLVPTS